MTEKLERFALLLMATLLIALAWHDRASSQEQLSYRERALADRMNAEINGGLSCYANALALQDRLQKAERELEEVKKKLAEISPPKTDGAQPSGN